MTPAVALLLEVSAVVGAATLLVRVCARMMGAAKRGGRGVRAIGAVVMLFGWGNMRDPRNDTVAEAQDGRIRKGTHSGDPLT